jgi:prolyl 4-hydroxylase
MTSYYDRAIRADRQGDLCEARSLLQRAVSEGEERARLTLAGVLLDGRGGPVDPQGALAALHPIEAADPLARRMLAAAIALGPGGMAAAAQKRLEHARNGDREAAVDLGVLLIAHAPALALELLSDAARRGSGLAAAALLQLAREHGGLWPELEQQLGALLSSAYPLAGPLKASMAELPRIGAPPQMEDDAGGFDRLDPAYGLDSDADTPLSDAPAIRARQGAIAPAVCNYLLAASWPDLRRAEVFNAQSGRTQEHPHRKAYSTSLPRSLQALPVLHMSARMAAATGARPLHGEGLAVLIYYPGDEYRQHLDCFTDDDGWASAELAAQGQRRATALTALNERFEGGETVFPRLDVGWRGRTGDMLTFENVTADGSPDPMSLHAGSAVRSGWKALASLWVRERVPGETGIAERGT